MNLAIHHERDLVRAEPTSWDLMPAAIQMAAELHMTDFVPKGLRGNKAAVMACLLAGHEMGFSPLMSLQRVHVIDGKPSVDAIGQRALILAAGHEIVVAETTKTRAVIYACRRGSTQGINFVATADEYRHLANKDTWKNYPADMLVARASGRAARGMFADVVTGMAYVTEELEDGFDQDSQPAAQDQVPAAGRRRRRAAITSARPAETPSQADHALEPALAVVNDEVQAPPPRPVVPPPPPAPPPMDEEPNPMPLNQQIAMVCREAGVERMAVIMAVTGKERGRDLTREEAIRVLEEARAIGRGERVIERVDDHWAVIDAPGEAG